MDLNIRKAIMHNVSNNSNDQLRDTIVDAIQDGREKMLPGLGVFFEVIWNQADEQERQEMVDFLEQGIKGNA